MFRPENNMWYWSPWKLHLFFAQLAIIVQFSVLTTRYIDVKERDSAEILTKQVFSLLSLSSLLFLLLLILFFKTQKHFWFFLLCVSLLSNQWPCAINSTFTMNLWFCSHPNHPLLDYLRAFRRVPLPSVSPVSYEVLSDHDFRTSHFFFFCFQWLHKLLGLSWGPRWIVPT